MHNISMDYVNNMGSKLPEVNHKVSNLCEDIHEHKLLVNESVSLADTQKIGALLTNSNMMNPKELAKQIAKLVDLDKNKVLKLANDWKDKHEGNFKMTVKKNLYPYINNLLEEVEVTDKEVETTIQTIKDQEIEENLKVLKQSIVAEEILDEAEISDEDLKKKFIKANPKMSDESAQKMVDNMRKIQKQSKNEEVETIEESSDTVKVAAEFIAKKAALRSSAVEKLINTEKLDADKLAQAVNSGKIKAGDEIMMALVGNDKGRKKALDKIRKVLKESRLDKLFIDVVVEEKNSITEVTKEVVQKEVDDYKEYFKEVLKTSAPTDKNIKRHFDTPKAEPLIALVKDLASSKYRVGMDGDSIVGPLKNGSISIHMTRDGLFFTSVEDFEDKTGFSKKLKSDTEVKRLFKRLALKESKLDEMFLNVITEGSGSSLIGIVSKNSAGGKDGLDLAFVKAGNHSIAITPNTTLKGYKKIKDIKVGDKVQVIFKDTPRGPEGLTLKSIDYVISKQMGLLKESKLDTLHDQLV